ncbi:MAG: sugar phosphate nucleotidyltransferase [archaeon]|jgi:NDP-sugar pyrophosphorylase family protein
MVPKEKKPVKKVAIVYMVAGLSSRFGGKIKQFAQVGPKGETLIEVSMQQAIKAGFKEIIFIVGEKTEIPFKDKFSAGYNETPIYYANQLLDLTLRDKPWGTTDALVSAKEVITSSFAVCNGDDLYGENALKKAREFLEKSEDEKACVAIGYELGKVLPEKGKTNRGIFKTDKNDNIISIEEVFEIEKNNLKEKNLKEKDLCSMNLFGLTEKSLELLEKKLISFKNTHKGDRKSECLLPVELSNLIKEKKITMKLLPTKDSWFGVTNPEDELVVRAALLNKKE